MDYGRLERALIKINRIQPSQVEAFRSRLRVLRDAGLPLVVRPGKGARIEYDFGHLLAYQLGISLETFGVSPSRAASIGRGTLDVGLGESNPCFEPTRPADEDEDFWAAIIPVYPTPEGAIILLDNLPRVGFFVGSFAEVTAQLDLMDPEPVPVMLGLINLSKLTRTCRQALAETE